MSDNFYDHMYALYILLPTVLDVQQTFTGNSLSELKPRAFKLSTSRKTLLVHWPLTLSLDLRLGTTDGQLGIVFYFYGPYWIVVYHLLEIKPKILEV